MSVCNLLKIWLQRLELFCWQSERMNGQTPDEQTMMNSKVPLPQFVRRGTKIKGVPMWHFCRYADTPILVIADMPILPIFSYERISYITDSVYTVTYMYQQTHIIYNLQFIRYVSNTLVNLSPLILERQAYLNFGENWAQPLALGNVVHRYSTLHLAQEKEKSSVAQCSTVWLKKIS